MSTNHCTAAMKWALVLLMASAGVLAQPKLPQVKKVIFDVPKPAACSDPKIKSPTYLPATVDTISWGYWYQGMKPSAAIRSGDVITVEMLTHQAGDDYDLMVKGDKAMEAIYKWDKDGMAIAFRGASAIGNGKHIMTGPIHICGAEPGDVVKIDILDLYPRKNPRTGKTYGSNTAAGWGYQNRLPFLDGKKREVTTIYELVKSPKKGDDRIMYAAPRYQFKVDKPKMPCQPTTTSVPRTYPGFEFNLTNANRMYFGVEVPCVDGQQAWPAIYVPGLIRNKTVSKEVTSINGKFKVPINLHIGNIGLAQDINVPFTSTTPSDTGNNLDNRRLGKGATLYLPVKVPGGLLAMGDCHAAQGDSEFDGTAIETSVTGKFRITLIKKGSEPKEVKGLDFPLIENANEWVLQGLTYKDYITELLANDSSVNPMGIIGRLSTLDRTMQVASNITRDWLMSAQGLTEDEAYTLMTLGIDFAVTQVVDQNWGIHTIIPKYVFKGKTDGSVWDLYEPVSFPMTSLGGFCKQTEFYRYGPEPTKTCKGLKCLPALLG